MKQPIMISGAVFVLSITVLGCAPVPSYAQGYGYYPDYDPPVRGYYRGYNPTVRRDYYSNGDYAPDGTYHSEDTVEDRRASYYSPGRNRAITRPRTTVDSWSEGEGQQTTRERTSWIGADGKPHSTTIEKNTVTDSEGNTHTDTSVTLRKARAQ